MRVPFLDLTRQGKRVREAVDRKIGAVFDSQQFVLGRMVEAFEEAFCQSVGCAQAVGMSSGTDAQLAILMAMGIGAGDAVITTPYTFFATAGCIHRTGAEPVFVDIRPDTFHMDAERLRECLQRLARPDEGRLRTPRGNVVRAVIPVHLFGACCDMDALREAVAPYDLPIIEDAAQAFGAGYRSAGAPRCAGSIADFAFFSFFPTKNLGGAGDGGMAVCRDRTFAEKLRLLRNHGMGERNFHRVVGGNFRLDALQAAVLQAKLPFVEGWNAARRRIAALYQSTLSDLSEALKLPADPWNNAGLENHHTWHQYVIRADRRDELLRHLQQEEIGHAVYYPIPLHRQECFAYLGCRDGDFPEAERAARESVALPIFAGLREEEIEMIATALHRFYLR
ncbi:MAG TPA: DegT/DnrJ/EryC1/StrS family aminotransferase [Terrimicrobiaceae bacterium]|nr:DegT/DnrJ/EryC1/StrS family aminotransferase [Terrimicrobiaceae bacterium]